MKVVRILFAGLGLFLSFSGAAEILLTRLSDHAYLLKAANYNTNIALRKTSKGIVLVDPMPGKDNLDALNHAMRTIAPISSVYVLNTHTHEDHTGGNDYFQKIGAFLLDSTEELTDIKNAMYTLTVGLTAYFFTVKVTLFLSVTSTIRIGILVFMPEVSLVLSMPLILFCRWATKTA